MSDVLAGAQLSRRVVRGGGVRMVGFALVNLMGALGSVVLLRYLGVADYGRYGTVIALIAVVSGIADAGLTVTGSRELALLSPGAGRRRLLGSVLAIRIALSTALVLAGLGIGLLAGYDDEMLIGILLAGAGAVLVAAQTTLLLPLAVKLRNTSLTVSDLVKQGVLLAGIVAVAALGGGLVGFFAVQVAIGLVALAIVPLLSDREDLTRPRWAVAEWWAVTKTALPIAVAAVLTVLYLRLLVVLTSVITTDYQTGLFATSARIMEMLAGIALIISGVILPVASVSARDDRGRLGYVIARTSEASLLLGALIAIVLILGAHPITVVLGGNEFAAAAPVLRLQGVAIVTIFIVTAWTTFLIADYHHRDLVRCVLLGLVTLVAAGIVLIHLHEARGAAIAAVLADIAYVVAVFFAVRRLRGRPTPIGLSFSARVALAAAASLGLGVALSGLPDAVTTAVAAVVFAALAALLRLVPPDVYAAVRR